MGSMRRLWLKMLKIYCSMRNSADVALWQVSVHGTCPPPPREMHLVCTWRRVWQAVRCFYAMALCAIQVQSARLKVTMLMLTCILMQEMDSIESAQQIMETDLRFQFNLDGAPLRLDYSHAAQPAAAVSASASSDWMCPGCSAVNFSR